MSINTSLLEFGALVGNKKWLVSQDQQESFTNKLAVNNPSTGDLLMYVPLLGAEEAEQCVNVASAALVLWRKKTAKERAVILMRWASLMVEHSEELANIMTLEQGKPIAEARGEIAYAASFLQWFAEEGKRSSGEILPAFKPNSQVQVTREPIGVASIITPWNFPVAMITRKLGAALAAGCTAVIKPSELTPLSALATINLGLKAGLSDGVVNIIMGDAPAIGRVWCAHPSVRVLSFTGSTSTGKYLAEACAPTIKRMSLELGGNASFIVFDDADIDLAVQQAMFSKFRNAGQTCVCANRFYVQAGVYDVFVEKFKIAIETLKVGDGLNPTVTIGPLINEAAVHKAQLHVDDAVAKGATLVIGGQSLGGNFYTPTLLTEMTDDMLPSHEESFAPIAPIYRFCDEAEVIARANNTEYGLSSYFCSQDLGRVMRVSEALEAGIIGVNEGIISAESVPFGGVKMSGLGREGSHQGMEEYTEIKYTLIGYPSQ